MYIFHCVFKLTNSPISTYFFIRIKNVPIFPSKILYAHNHLFFPNKIRQGLTETPIRQLEVLVTPPMVPHSCNNHIFPSQFTFVAKIASINFCGMCQVFPQQVTFIQDAYIMWGSKMVI